MKFFSIIFCFIALISSTSHAADDINTALQACINTFAPAFTTQLESAQLNLESSNLAEEVASLLQPQMNNILQTNQNCITAKSALENYKGAEFSIDFPPNHVFDIELQFAHMPSQAIVKPEELESLLPWFGILVVKKGSLDKYASAQTPIISSEYMKRNRDTFFPGNSDKALGMVRGCTHGNHTAHDKDVVNRAAHLTFDEKDSFWTGNDYYVYDGEDVYWGTAQLIGEIALAVVTLGASSAVTASKTAAQTAVATDRALKAQRAITLAKRAEKLKKFEDSYKAAGATAKATKAAQLGKETRQAARLALQEAGAGTVSQLTNTEAIANMGRLLEASGVAQETVAAAKPLTWVSALAKPWRLIKPGIQTLKPANIAKLYGPGVSWGKRIKRAAVTAAAGGLGYELIKAFGYSTAAAQIDDNLKFNSFGLLSADDLEGRDNQVSHGAWIQFEEAGEINEDDTLNEALAFAEAFQKDMDTINRQDPQCDVDIYVVQPGISNPAKLGTREVYYVIQNPAASLRVSK